MKKEKLDAAADDILFQEINEELKNEKMLKFWKKYGVIAMVIVIVALTCAVSYESLVAWHNKKAKAWANTYSQAYNLQIQGDYDGSLAIFKDMAEKNDGIYRDLAKMQTVNILLAQNKIDDACKQSLREMAIIKLVSYKLENAPAEEINALLEPVLAANGKFVNTAKEMKAMLAIREGNTAQAQEIYAEILNSQNLPETLKIRTQNMLAALNESNLQ